MITLNGQREIAGCQVYRDDVDPLAWYVMPQAPRVSRDDRDKPMLSMVWYRRDVSQLTEEERKTRLGGGILSVSVELSTTEDQMAEIREAIGADPIAQRRAGHLWRGPFEEDPKKFAKALKIGTVPIKDGTVSISVLAEAPAAGAAAGEFVASLVGVGRVSMVGRQRASFMAKLTQDGAVLLWEMLERDLAAIHVAYDLTFDHRLDAVTMSVWCDAKKTYNAVHDQWQKLTDDATFREEHSDGWTTLSYGRNQTANAREKIFSVATATQTSNVTIIPEAGADAVPPEQIQELIQSGSQMIADFLAATFLQWNPGADVQVKEMPTLATELPEYGEGRKYGHHSIEQYSLRTWDETMQATLSHTFTSKAVLQGHLGPNDNLTGVLDGQRVEDFRTQVELEADWYKYLDVEIVSTADFDNDPVDLVKVHLAYDESGRQGRIHEVKDFVFQKGTTPQRFLAFLADPAKRDYAYEYEVFYKGTGDTFTVRGTTDETILVLDADRMGVLQVDVLLGLVDWDQIKSVLVTMWYGSGSTRKEVVFPLDKGNQTFRWNQVIARKVDEPYHYQVTFVDQANQRIVLEPGSSRSNRLILDQPLQQSMEVAVVPAGSFGEGGLLQQVVVALRYRDEDYLVDDVFTLKGENDSKIWKVPLLHPDRRTYEYQTTVFYSDGVTREDGWQRSDKSVLALGDPFGYRVQISPYLLKNRGFAFATLHLTFSDPAAGIRAEKTLEITDFAKPLYWRFRLGAPDRHTYSYQLSLFKETGEELIQNAERADKEVLVLRPPV